jgi:hypothetical protein
MSTTAADWDARVDRLILRLPGPVRGPLAWLREPGRWPIRVVAAVLFILGGIFSILPILGLWMLPVGLALLSQDLPFLKPPLEWSARRLENLYRSLARRLKRRRA